MKELLKGFHISEKFGKDVFWTMGSLVFLALSGIILNIVIAGVYGAEVLGSFNQVYAVYIVCSQFAAAGIHLSTVKHVAEHQNHKRKFQAVVGSAVFLVTGTALAVCLVLFFIGPLIGGALQSEDVTAGLSFIIPAVLFFSLNKVLLAVLNGLRRMKAYALFHTLRYVLILLVLLFCLMTRQAGRTLPVVFTAAESVLFVCLAVFSRIPLGFLFLEKSNRDWIKTHFVFGIKSFMGGALAELNTRVDVIMLGLFMSDGVVGIYSFAAVIIEGFLQILVVLRTNVNPILTGLYSKGHHEKLKATIERGIKMLYPVMVVAGVVSVCVYPVFINVLMPDTPFIFSWPVFGILMTGLVMSSGYFPFNMVLTQAGYPGRTTAMIGFVVLSNIVLNLILIPALGMNGAAIATCFSFLLSVVYLKMLVKSTIGLQI